MEMNIVGRGKIFITEKLGGECKIASDEIECKTVEGD